MIVMREGLVTVVTAEGLVTVVKPDELVTFAREVNTDGASSKMKHALVPPMPKLLTTTRRGTSLVSNACSSSGSANCHSFHRMFGFGSFTLMVAGIFPVYTHSAPFTRLATPAAPSM